MVDVLLVSSAPSISQSVKAAPDSGGGHIDLLLVVELDLIALAEFGCPALLLSSTISTNTLSRSSVWVFVCLPLGMGSGRD